MPPSKQPLLTLMKQARAFGLGVVLATQNPVDLDYKGLSNAGTWFIGRLQTERDKARVIEGLLGAGGDGLDKSKLERLLANLGNRVFLMRNVHDDAPVLFRTRWALSYLRGPLTLQEIARIGGQKVASDPAPASQATVRPTPSVAQESAIAPVRPVIPSGIREYYLARATGGATRYLPRVYGNVRLHFIDKTAGIDAWETRSYIAPLTNDGTQPDWAAADIGGDIGAQLSDAGVEGATYADTPAAFLRPQNYKTWTERLASYANETAQLAILRCPTIGATFRAGRY